jgi:indole-3-glycerol phosphate synthase
MSSSAITGAPGPSVLERILSQTRQELDRRQRECPLQELQSEIPERSEPRAAGRGLAGALRGSPLGVIAEFKRCSPSAGVLREGAEVGEIVRAYEWAGASAVSILTEGPNFAGSLQDLTDARAACDLPILRKDFIVDHYQLYEAVLAGADAVLLIVAAIERGELEDLYSGARELGLEVLMEVHDRAELHTALRTDCKLLGINNRDLRDFSVDVRRTSELLGEIPPDVTVVSESGIATAKQLRELQRQGVHGVLIGESLMRAADPAQALRALLSFTSDEGSL